MAEACVKPEDVHHVKAVENLLRKAAGVEERCSSVCGTWG